MCERRFRSVRWKTLAGYLPSPSAPRHAVLHCPLTASRRRTPPILTRSLNSHEQTQQQNTAEISIAKKLSLDDLKVHSFVTSLTRSEAVEPQARASLISPNTRRHESS